MPVDDDQVARAGTEHFDAVDIVGPGAGSRRHRHGRQPGVRVVDQERLAGLAHPLAGAGLRHRRAPAAGPRTAPAAPGIFRAERRIRIGLIARPAGALRRIPSPGSARPGASHWHPIERARPAADQGPIKPLQAPLLDAQRRDEIDRTRGEMAKTRAQRRQVECGHARGMDQGAVQAAARREARDRAGHRPRPGCTARGRGPACAKPGSPPQQVGCAFRRLLDCSSNLPAELLFTPRPAGKHFDCRLVELLERFQRTGEPPQELLSRFRRKLPPPGRRAQLESQVFISLFPVDVRRKTFCRRGMAGQVVIHGKPPGAGGNPADGIAFAG